MGTPQSSSELSESTDWAWFDQSQSLSKCEQLLQYDWCTKIPDALPAVFSWACVSFVKSMTYLDQVTQSLSFSFLIFTSWFHLNPLQPYLKSLLPTPMLSLGSSLVKQPTRGFSSGHDPRLMRWSPAWGSALCTESAWDSPAPSPCPCPCALTLSLNVD